MLLKSKVYSCCINLIADKITASKKAFKEITEEAKTDSKSSAGDKHETSRALMQIEQEKISRQLQNIIDQKKQLEKINIDQQSEKIISGSLILTNQGYFFLSVGIGKIMVNDTPVFVLSPSSPLGAKLTGLKKGDSTTINGTNYIIMQIID